MQGSIKIGGHFNLQASEHQTQIEQKSQTQTKPQKTSNWEAQSWLTDQDIDQAYQQLPVNSKFCLHSSLQSTLIEFRDGLYFTELLNSLAPEGDKQLVFIPINNSNVHWSLLVYELATQTFYHLDSSSAKMNSPKAWEIAQELLKHKGLPTENYQELACPLQNDGHNCGIAVLAFTERIRQNYDVQQGLANVQLGEINFEQEREIWQLRSETWENTAYVEQFPK